MATLSSPSINAVLRVPEVTVSRASLEAATGPVDRFEVSKDDRYSFAHVNAPEDCTWADIISLIERVGRVLLEHAERKEIGRPCLDIAFFINEGRMNGSLLVPHDVIAAIGRFGFDLEASAYLAAEG